jgi:hypothetical protein
LFSAMKAICWWQFAAAFDGSPASRSVASTSRCARFGVAEHRDGEAVQAARLGADASGVGRLQEAWMRRSLVSA